MQPLVYADFSCPECFVAHRQCAALEGAGVAVDWRAVESRPRLQVTPARRTEQERAGLAQRLADVADLLPPGDAVPQVSAVDPRTTPAVSAYAEVHGLAVAADVRAVLFDLYWRAGADLGDPGALRTPLTGPLLRSGAAADPLRESGWAISVTGGPVTTDAYRRIARWRAEWADLGRPPLPVVLVDGATLVGVDALHRLAKEVDRAGADAVPDGSDPYRYPDAELTPPRGWVSQTGGRWRTAYRVPHRVAEPA